MAWHPIRRPPGASRSARDDVCDSWAQPFCPLVFPAPGAMLCGAWGRLVLWAHCVRSELRPKW